MLHSRSDKLHRHKKTWESGQTIASLRQRLVNIVLLLLFLIFCHSVAMIVLEDLPPWDAFWLTLTTITTVGYGDISAKSVAGQMATVGLLYIPGIALLGQFIGEYIDYRVIRREKMAQGLWRWTTMQEHILILNTPQTDGDQYLVRLVEQINKTPELCELPIQILTPVYPDGLPLELRSMGVVHSYGTPTNAANLEQVNAIKAKYIFVISHNATSINPDSQSIDILEHLGGISLRAHVVAECVDDNNRKRFLRLAADSVIRPIRAYPELAVRALVAPGTEQVMENLFTHQGAHPNRYTVNLNDMTWSEIVCSIMNAGHGTAIAYVNISGEVITAPTANTKINGQALIVIVRQEKEPTLNEIKACIA